MKRTEFYKNGRFAVKKVCRLTKEMVNETPGYLAALILGGWIIHLAAIVYTMNAAAKLRKTNYRKYCEIVLG